jgi:peptidyl-prolyl cis-trans isomerase C
MRLPVKRRSTVTLEAFAAVALATGMAAAPGFAVSSAPAPAAAPKSAPAASGSGVVARVNGSAILRRDFDLAVQVEFRRRGPDARHHEDLQAVRAAVLDSLVDNELLYQKASQAKVTVSDADTQKEVQKLRQSLGSADEAAAFMKGAGLSDKDLSNQVRRSLVVKRFAEKEVTGQVSVTDAQAKAWYDSHPDDVNRPEAVHISQIVVRIPPGADATTRSNARQKIEAILQELRAGKDFGEMARLHSDGPEAKKGGDSGWVWTGGGALPAVEHAALQLKPGETTDVVESLRGLHIIKAIARRPAGAVPYEEMHDRIVTRLQNEQREARLRDYLAGLRKTARIEKFV